MAKQHFAQGGYSGKLGATVGFHRAGDYYIRRYARPGDPKSPAQLSAREMFAMAIKLTLAIYNFNRGFRLWPEGSKTQYNWMTSVTKLAIQTGQDVHLWPPAVPRSGATLAAPGGLLLHWSSPISATLEGTIAPVPTQPRCRAIVWGVLDGQIADIMAFEGDVGTGGDVTLASISDTHLIDGAEYYTSFFCFSPAAPLAQCGYSGIITTSEDLVAATTVLDWWINTPGNKPTQVYRGDWFYAIGEYLGTWAGIVDDNCNFGLCNEDIDEFDDTRDSVSAGCRNWGQLVFQVGSRASLNNQPVQLEIRGASVLPDCALSGRYVYPQVWTYHNTTRP